MFVFVPPDDALDKAHTLCKIGCSKIGGTGACSTSMVVCSSHRACAAIASECNDFDLGHTTSGYAHVRFLSPLLTERPILRTLKGPGPRLPRGQQVRRHLRPRGQEARLVSAQRQRRFLGEAGHRAPVPSLGGSPPDPCIALTPLVRFLWTKYRLTECSRRLPSAAVFSLSLFLGLLTLQRGALVWCV